MMRSSEIMLMDVRGSKNVDIPSVEMGICRIQGSERKEEKNLRMMDYSK